jgi:hypothetical protein
VSDFKWNSDDADAVVLSWQPRTAVYCTASGNVVVRQEADPMVDDNDDQVFLTPMGALAVAWEMIRVAHELGIPTPPPELRKAINIGPAGPVVTKSPSVDPGPLLAVMEAANDPAGKPAKAGGGQ